MKTRNMIVSMTIMLTLCAAGCNIRRDKKDDTDFSQKVSVGGHALKIRCQGEGYPVVVLESGLGDSSEVWQHVFFNVAEFTRVCAYDRAGLGESDPGPAPRDTRTIATELHTLLGNVAHKQVIPPYLLVGHSMGGIHIRTFADQYPPEVAGFVFVDPAVEPEGTQFSTGHGKQVPRYLEQDVPPGVAAEMAGIEPSFAQAQALGAMPDVPTIVLSAMAGKTPEERQFWYQEHERLIAGLSDATHVTVETSEHYIHVEDPARVVEAIQYIYHKIAF